MPKRSISLVEEAVKEVANKPKASKKDKNDVIVSIEHCKSW